MCSLFGGGDFCYLCRPMRTPIILVLLSFSLLTQERCKRVSPEMIEAASSHDDASVSIAFYNVENLFDTSDDPLTDDQEFLPGAEKQWTLDRFTTKLDHLAEVISKLDVSLPDVVGLAEVENRYVLEQLVAHPKLKAANYQIVHRNSPDGRGIDCALLYNPEQFEIDKQSFIRFKLPVKDRKNTRDIVYARGIHKSDTLHFFVNHWPSRYGGQEASEPKRLTAAYELDKRVDSIRRVSPNAQVLCMGDFNDHPNNKSLKTVLGAGVTSDHSQLYNFMWSIHKNGGGSYNYKGDWGALDQFVGTWNMLEESSAFVTHREAAQIIKHDWMMYVNDENVAFPSRTYGGPNYYGGYSDHLPILLTLKHQ